MDLLIYLKDKGFYLPPRARSNYAMTALSLGSSLSMDYLHGTSMSDLPDNCVKAFVETNGYQYIERSSMNPTAESVHDKSISLGAFGPLFRRAGYKKGYKGGRTRIVA